MRGKDRSAWPMASCPWKAMSRQSIASRLLCCKHLEREYWIIPFNGTACLAYHRDALRTPHPEAEPGTGKGVGKLCVALQATGTPKAPQET